MSSQFIMRGFNPSMSQQMLSDSIFRQTRQQSESGSSVGLSALRKASSSVQAADKLLEDLAELLEGAAQSEPVPGGQPIGSEAPAQGDLSNELLQLLESGVDPATLNLNLSPEELAEFQRLAKEYQLVMKSISNLDKMLEQLRNGETTPTEVLEHIITTRELLAAFEAGLIRKLTRQAEWAWYLRWRMTYREEMETKTNLRASQKEGPIQAHSLPQGVHSAEAHAALGIETPRADLEHGSQLLQQLHNLASQAEQDPQAEQQADNPYV